jgi:hypothetical protein
LRFSPKELAGIVFFLNSATASQTSWNRPRNCGRKTHSTRQWRGSQSSRESIRGTPGNHSAGHWNSAPSQLRFSSSWFAKARNSHCPGQGFVAETLGDNVVNYVCWDRADLRWQYADCARLVDESGKKGWQKLDGAQRGQVHPGLIWPEAVGARPSSRARTRPLSFLGYRIAAGPCRSQSRWDGKMGVKWPKKGVKWPLLREPATLLFTTQLLYYQVVGLIVVEKSTERQIATTIYSLRTCVENMVTQIFKKAEKCSIP